MAEEHNQLKYGSPLSVAASVFAGGGYGEVGISRMSETLTPTLPLWDIENTPDLALPRGEILFGRFIQTAAAPAGRFASIEIVNPTGSSKLAIIRRAGLLQATELDLSIDNGGAIAANPVTTRGCALDGRYVSPGAVSQCTLVSGDLAAVAVNVQWRLRNASQETNRICWVLPPGKKLFLVSTVAVAAMGVNLFFSERTPFPGELQQRG